MFFMSAMNAKIGIMHARELFRAAVESVLPTRLIQSAVSTNGKSVQVGNSCWSLGKNVYVIGFGKAVLGMAKALEDILGEHIVNGILSIPKGIQHTFRQHGKMEMLLQPHSKIQVFEGALNNMPDLDSYNATLKIVELARNVGKGDLVFVLISGGGSTLLTAPAPPISLQEKIAVTKLMVRQAADINSLNTVRQQMSIVKGGGLARLLYPAEACCLILSDIVGDPLDLIASGPTVNCIHTSQDALNLFKQLNIMHQIPDSVLQVLKSRINSSSHLSHVQNHIVGRNATAIEFVAKKARDMGYKSIALSSTITGEAKEVGKMYAKLLHQLCKIPKIDKIESTSKLLELKDIVSEKDVSTLSTMMEDVTKEAQGVCLVFGGETVVQVKGNGKGGRNQEMALSCGIELDELFSKDASNFDVTFLSAGTDGIEANTPAAGAVTYLGQMTIAREQGLNPENALKENDSHNFFHQLKDGQDLVITGHTGTNVMDIQILLIKANT